MELGHDMANFKTRFTFVALIGLLSAVVVCFIEMAGYELRTGMLIVIPLAAVIANVYIGRSTFTTRVSKREAEPQAVFSSSSWSHFVPLQSGAVAACGAVLAFGAIAGTGVSVPSANAVTSSSFIIEACVFKSTSIKTRIYVNGLNSEAV